MKTKLEMANDWYMKHSESPSFMDTEIKMAWDYADKMQAEVDKREEKKALRDAESHKTFMDMLNQKEQNHHDELVSIGLEDWQPDWSQAPDGYNRFVVGSDHGIGFFTDIEPELIDQEYFYVGHNAKVVENHNYQGDWKESLRERP